MFKQIDTNGDGNVSTDEFKAMLEEAGVDPTSDEMKVSDNGIPSFVFEVLMALFTTRFAWIYLIPMEMEQLICLNLNSSSATKKIRRPSRGIHSNIL
jgi:hypothetical protein